jgi:hypothetical protein
MYAYHVAKGAEGKSGLRSIQGGYTGSSLGVFGVIR